MPTVARILAISIFLGATTATAAPPARVLLADPDPELLHAVEASLAPWHLSIVVDAAVPSDDTAAHERAEITGVQFVVWRERDQLVVFDRSRDASERRPARAGAFDPVTAASAALTVKTMMRLPPIETAAAPSAPPSVSAAAAVEPAPRTIDARFEAGIATRLATGSDGGVSTRAELAAMIRPWSALRVGLRGDLGTAWDVDSAGFKGTWRDWAVLAAASWTFARGDWEIEPWLGAGVERGTLDGKDGPMARTEHATLATVRGGIVGRRRFGFLTAGVGIELASVPSAPTYTKETPGMGRPQVFGAPQFSVVIGVLIAADVGR